MYVCVYIYKYIHVHTHIYIQIPFLILFSIWSIPRHWILFPMLYSRTSMILIDLYCNGIYGLPSWLRIQENSLHLLEKAFFLLLSLITPAASLEVKHKDFTWASRSSLGMRWRSWSLCSHLVCPCCKFSGLKSIFFTFIC